MKKNLNEMKSTLRTSLLPPSETMTLSIKWDV